MILASFAVISGLTLLLWSADRFVIGSAATAYHFGMPSLLTGMVIVGFGTSAPEIVVSTLSSFEGKSGIALGNPYGSNIANIALILGVTALLKPISVHSQVLRKELPALTFMTLIAGWQLYDGQLSRTDAFVLLGVFGGIMTYMILYTLRSKTTFFDRRLEIDKSLEKDLNVKKMTIKIAIFWILFGLLLLIISSRILIWGAVEIAHYFGVRDLIIALTIIAIGTSLPELASSVMAARRGEHDIALGNVLGSNMFNTMVATGLAGMIHSITVEPDILNRDMPIMVLLTVSLFIFGYGFRGAGRINRLEGGIMVISYIVYTSYLISTIQFFNYLSSSPLLLNFTAIISYF